MEVAASRLAGAKTWIEYWRLSKEENCLALRTAEARRPEILSVRVS